MRVEMLTFLLAGAICLFGALGVVLLRNPVHNALSLVATLFGVAVLFIAEGAHFLAAIQVIVYAGAIVVLFLFVIMLLGVDRASAEGAERVPGQRPIAIAAGLAILGLSLTAILAATERATGTPSVVGPLDDGLADINRLGRVLFTDYIFAVEITAALLTVSVVGAVMLARRSKDEPIDLDEFPDGTTASHLPDYVDDIEELPVDDDVTAAEDDAAELDAAGVTAEAEPSESSGAEPNERVS